MVPCGANATKSNVRYPPHIRHSAYAQIATFAIGKAAPQSRLSAVAQSRTFQWEDRRLESGHPFITMIAYATSVIVMLSADAHSRRH